jgi:hypothetical protein
MCQQNNHLAHEIIQTLFFLQPLFKPLLIKFILIELSVAMRNLWCLEKNSILSLIISAMGTVPQSLFKNLKILDLENTLVVEIQKGILLYSCHIVRKFPNIDAEHKTQKSPNVEATIMLISN